MKELKIYLSGQISENRKCVDWRTNIEKYVESSGWNIIILNPCNHILTDPIEIVKKDFEMVKESDICIVNFEHYTPNRQIIGTFFEISWYRTLYPTKLIYGVDNHKCSIKNHPFIKTSISKWFDWPLDAVKEIINEYKGYGFKYLENLAYKNV